LADQSISTSRQFIVYGTDLALRGTICDLAERTKRELLSLLNQRDEWRTPIVINAQYRQANLPELPGLSVALGQTGFGLKLQLDLVVNSGVTQPEIRRELLRALLLELMYRGQPNITAGAAYTSPPDWLLDGIPEEAPELSQDRLARLLALPVAAKKVLPLEEFLAQRPELLDSAGLTLYRAYSMALVDLIRHTPEGSQSLLRFIVDLPTSSNDSMAELRSHFAGFFARAVAEKNWEEQVARLSTQPPYQLLGIGETERLLAEKLRFETSERGVEKWYEVEEFAFFRRSGTTQKFLQALANDLRVLGTRANPIYLPIIAEYADITGRLLRGKTAGIGKRLERLRAARKTLAAQMRQIDDYLNWFEATGLVRASGEFTGYMRAAERAVRPERTKRDAISVYLDVLETQFEN
jgi:GNAT superfamily N-acetyltransferase